MTRSPKKKSENDSRPASTKVRDYVMSLPTGARARFRALRDTVRAAVHCGVDGFGYNMPAVMLHG